LARRPDLFARRAAVSEAQAKLRLTIADRYDNPVIGPAYALDPTRVNFIGAQFTLPLPAFNTHRGEIMQREAERTQAALRVSQTETVIHQDVEAALLRLSSARLNVDTIANDVLPQLEAHLQDMMRLFEQGDPAADVLRVIEIRRRLLKARDGYLTALWELSQARADLAGAVGDPALALVPEGNGANDTKMEEP
jgi:outer membrane protein TolC